MHTDPKQTLATAYEIASVSRESCSKKLRIRTFFMNDKRGKGIQHSQALLETANSFVAAQKRQS